MASAVVVYESVFGDAEKIARAIAEGLSSHLDVDVVAAKDAPRRARPRRPAARRRRARTTPWACRGRPPARARSSSTAPRSPTPAPGCTSGWSRTQSAGALSAAAFDTRLDHPKLITKLDHASKTEEKLLHRARRHPRRPGRALPRRRREGPARRRRGGPRPSVGSGDRRDRHRRHRAGSDRGLKFVCGSADLPGDNDVDHGRSKTCVSAAGQRRPLRSRRSWPRSKRSWIGAAR